MFVTRSAEFGRRWGGKGVVVIGVRDAFHRAMAAAVHSERVDDRVDADLRRRLGIDPTGEGVAVETPPTLRPALTVTATDWLMHMLALQHPDGPPGRVWPAGTVAVEVRTKVGGDASPSVDDYPTVRTITRRRTTFRYDPSDAGQVAHLLTRYLALDGSAGPWSQVVSTTIAAIV